ncbi:MAG: hypothetical protein K0R44_1067 [Thermomicrobiales bacterium]|jgi:hypothetical protein|nr:hypothetical protein [Thermomicrobiales bacterium]MDF3015842.1 hypothetical protein [Thermomicrobiales bacterium]
MSHLRLLLKRVVLLPGPAVALRLGDVVPRHDLPPSLAEADLLIPAANVVPGIATRAPCCSNPTS